MITKKAYVIGTHANNSLSPLIFNHWFKKYGVDAKYSHKIIKEKNFNKEINKILKEDGLCGINVTTPFKEKIIKKIHHLDSHSKIIGAANCITIKNNKYYGSNTDWVGFGEALINTNIKNKILKSAGCYQIEKSGPNIIENIIGDFFNVMGFPLFPFLVFLKKFNIKK